MKTLIASATLMTLIVFSAGAHISRLASDKSNSNDLQDIPSQNQSSDDNLASLQETLDWLKEKLAQSSRGPSAATEVPSGESAGTQYAELIDVKGCKITLRVHDEHRDNITWVDEWTANLSDADPISVKADKYAKKYATYYRLYFSNFKNKQSIQYHFTGFDNGKLVKDEKSALDRMDSIPIYDEEISKRMIRALRHAIVLCGGKTEPF